MDSDYSHLKKLMTQKIYKREDDQNDFEKTDEKKVNQQICINNIWT